MFVKKFSITSGTSGTSFVYSDQLILTSKYYDKKELALKVDIKTGAVSGTLDLIGAIAENSGGTYTPFITATGTSKILEGGTSLGGQLGNGSYFIPLTIAPAVGVTMPLRAVPYFKLGAKGSFRDVPFDAWLCVG